MHERQNSRLACLQEDEVQASFDPRQKPSSCVKRLVLKILDSSWTTTFMVTLTVYALFGDDVRSAAFSAKDDDVFFSLAATCMFFFLMEVCLASWAKPGYLWSFFFYLDSISVVSLIPDIGWVWERMVGGQSLGDGSKVSQVQTAGRTSRAGARTTRIIRVIRVVRLVRLSKLYKNAKKTIDQQSNTRVGPSDEYSIPEESKIGKKLNELTIKRVIILVLGLLLLLPLFDVTFFEATYTSWEYGAEDLSKSLTSPSFLSARDLFIDYHKDDLRPLILLSMQVNDMAVIWSAETDVSDLRLAETYYALHDEILAVFNIRADTVFSAQLNICQTVFICLVLTLGAVYLTQDANELVITPIEKMIDKVKRMARNPLAAMNDKMKDVYDLEEEQVSEKTFWLRRFCCKPKKAVRGMETSLLEDAIMKIGALLALGFGEAGSQIIADNLSRQSNINPIADGTKVLAIFAFCDIRNFTDTTEVLQERVMVFVNEIAGIVHHTVDEYMGAANKNVGDAFLVVWKYPHEHTVQRNSKLYLLDIPYVNALADLALLAVLKIIAKVNSSASILKYREYPELKKRMPNYSVKLGFGLHMGWAIEGAIGSEFKVDASYLSPNVNLTMKLEELTKVYGVPLVVSNAVYKILSSFMHNRCRHVDTVKLPAAHKPLRLFTYDISLTRLVPCEQKAFDKEASKAKRREKQRRLGEGKLDAADLLYKSKKLRSISESLLPGYIDAFERGMTEYEHGNWQGSRELLEQSLEFKPVDGPTQAILSYMREYGFKAPDDWPGYRTLFGH